MDPLAVMKFLFVAPPIILGLAIGFTGFRRMFQEKVGAGISLLMLAAVVLGISLCVWAPMIAIATRNL